MKVIANDERLRAFYDAGEGFIYNDFGGPKQSTQNAAFNILHRASCPHCNPRRDHNAMTVNTAGQKIFFATYREAIDWLLDNRPSNYSKCRDCDPR